MRISRIITNSQRSLGKGAEQLYAIKQNYTNLNTTEHKANNLIFLGLAPAVLSITLSALGPSVVELFYLAEQ